MKGETSNEDNIENLIVDIPGDFSRFVCKKKLQMKTVKLMHL